MKTYLKTKDVARAWGISERRINVLCKEGRIHGAMKFGNAWAIPADCKKPADARKKAIERSYKELKRRKKYPAPNPSHKLNVFISSKCGQQDYDNVRAELKGLIESTNLATVYLFEETGPSVVTARQHYLFHLQDVDVCVFLIDNNNAIPAGVQEEIDTAKKYSIPSMFYFIDSGSGKQTPLQKSLTGADHVKTKTVSSFDEILEIGAQAFIDDVVMIYRMYCNRSIRFSGNLHAASNHNILSPNINASIVPKSIIGQVDKTRRVLAHHLNPWIDDLTQHTNTFDEMCERFLHLMLNGDSIKSFNSSMLVEELGKLQDLSCHQIVQIRWKAIQSYFNGNVTECINHLKQALEKAKKLELPDWMIMDILIDLRNQGVLSAETGIETVIDFTAQDSLNESRYPLYYPLIDRLHKTLYEKALDAIYKEKLKTPGTVTYGQNISIYTDAIATSFAIAMYNGSLTHLLAFYEHIRRTLYVLSQQYNDWHIRRDLLKYVIFTSSVRDIDKLEEAFPDIFNRMDSLDASEIYQFTCNHAIPVKRLEAQLRALKSIGYYLDDDAFSQAWDEAKTELTNFLASGCVTIFLGQNIFPCLSGIALRLKQDEIAFWGTLFAASQYRQYHLELFDFLSRYWEPDQTKRDLTDCLLQVLLYEMNDEYKSNRNYQRLLISLRRKSISNSKQIDSFVSTTLPEFFSGLYLLETSSDDISVSSSIVNQFIASAHSRNMDHQNAGILSRYANRVFLIIRNIIKSSNGEWDESQIKNALDVATECIVESGQHAMEKCDAMELILCLTVRYPKIITKHAERINQLIRNIEQIVSDSGSLGEDLGYDQALRFSIMLLSIHCADRSPDILLPLFPYFHHHHAALIRICEMIEDYVSNLHLKNKTVRALYYSLLQQAMVWLESDPHSVRYHGYRILLLLLKKNVHQSIIEDRIVYAVEYENAYIKSLIFNETDKLASLTEETRGFVFNKLKSDANYVIRNRVLL